MIDLLSDPQIWVSCLTLTALELVLGIDNVIFISILLDNFPRKQREFARIVGLSLAMLMRIGLLFVVSWIDAVFSLDSIITAVGMVEEIEVIIAAVVTSVAVLIACAAHAHIGRFVTESIDQDACALVSGSNRGRADRRWLRPPCAQGIHLFFACLRGLRRDA
jgi:predicted tellurium resistance membrane protein TerC